MANKEQIPEAANHHSGSLVTNMTIATATDIYRSIKTDLSNLETALTLSATGSIKAPNGEHIPHRRAKYPSRKSVKQETAKMALQTLFYTQHKKAIKFNDEYRPVQQQMKPQKTEWKLI